MFLASTPQRFAHAPNGWEHYTFTAVASGTDTYLRFYNGLAPCTGTSACEDWGTRVYLDDISVSPALTETPEPATLALTVTGLGVLAGVARRRQQASPRSPEVC